MNNSMKNCLVKLDGEEGLRCVASFFPGEKKTQKGSKTSVPQTLFRTPRALLELAEPKIRPWESPLELPFLTFNCYASSGCVY